MRQSLQVDPRREQSTTANAPGAEWQGRLLVAEDAKCMQHVIRSMLAERNVKAEMVENGQTACELAEKSKAEGNPYDLILMDMQMPQMSGFEAVRWLRTHGWDGPIVALTAYTTASDRMKCLDAGCDDHLSKPITEMTLQNVFTRQMNGTLRNLSTVERD